MKTFHYCTLLLLVLALSTFTLLAQPENPFMITKESRELALCYVAENVIDQSSFFDCLRGQPRLKVLFLPSYSPNLNLIERLWKFFYEKVRYNKYFEKFADFVSSTKEFFRCRTKFKEELRSRLTENFQMF